MAMYAVLIHKEWTLLQDHAASLQSSYQIVLDPFHMMCCKASTRRPCISCSLVHISVSTAVSHSVKPLFLLTIRVDFKPR